MRAPLTDDRKGTDMQIVMTCYNAQPANTPGLFSIIMNIGRLDTEPLPQRKVDVKNAAEALTVFAAYVEEAKATGKLAACSLRAGEGRKAPGFDKAKATLPPYTIVNDEVTI